MAELSLLGFAAALTEMTLEVDHATHSGLEAAARIVQTEAKAEIGHYQGAIGGLPAWAELADNTKDDRVRHGYTENDPGLRSGAMRDSIETNVSGHEAMIGSDDDHLVYFELGTTKQPPRTVLAGALMRKEKEVVHEIGERFVGTLVGGEVIGGALRLKR
ncbi:hypothetical protein J2D73_18490 [Acetobacter sacchari]|uniref:Uncharacterized protein n=1 Tax=Acetobacter sacchari TaxID=2661687 RepID=A0ABS3M0W5_9PROT|nr:hypothetical protein [Acetobacter sacchari]MBO1361774.1 hypothetical protein [Acetobacter sacchari]